MNTKGFARYGSLENQEFLLDVMPVVDAPVKSPADIMLDKIFAIDERGWPQSTLSVYLSEKTSDDVRRFIEDKILTVRDQVHAVNDPQVVSQFNKLESSFIAEASRNRFESVQDYESRLKGIIDRMDADSYYDHFKSLIKNFKGDK